MSHTIRRRNSHRAHHRRQRELNQPTATATTKKARPPMSERHALVTDHAVLRWLERVTGIDVAAQVREEILSCGRERLIGEIGNGKIRIADSNVVLQVATGRVVTVKTRGGGDA